MPNSDEDSPRPTISIYVLADRLLSTLSRSGLAGKNIIALSLLLAVASIVTACPDYRHFGAYWGVPWAAEALQWQFGHPLEPIPVDVFAKSAQQGQEGVVEHLQKRSFRPAVPFISHVFGVSLNGAIVAQQLGAFVFIFLTLALARRITGDYLTAFLFAFTIATSFPSQWAFNDFVYFDGIAYLCVLISLWSTSFALTTFAIAFGGLTDELVLAAVPLCYFFQALRLNKAAKLFTLRMLIPSDRLQWALALGVAIALVCRVALGLRWGTMANFAGISLAEVKGNLVWLPLALFLIVKGAILPLTLAALAMLITRNASLLLVMTSASLPIVFEALLVYDLSRSLAYAFPIFFIALAYLASLVGEQTLRRCFLASALFNLAMPTYFIMAGTVYALLPIIRLL